MPDEAGDFQTKGSTWSDRADLSEFNAVLSPTGTQRSNNFLHGTSLFAAHCAMRLNRHPNNILDFGCGNGRFVRFFGKKAGQVVGTEVTPEMIQAARRIGVPPNTSLHVTDGIHIPEPNESFDMIWCCGVLRYSLFVNNPVYDQIAAEMFRVLRPGGWVVTVEMYVDTPPAVFMEDFQQAGFTSYDVRVIHRYGGRIERLFKNRFIPTRMIVSTGKLSAAVRYYFDDPFRTRMGLRDYLFIWRKPILASHGS